MELRQPIAVVVTAALSCLLTLSGPFGAPFHFSLFLVQGSRVK